SRYAGGARRGDMASAGETKMTASDRQGAFGTLLQQYRAAAGLSQEELAERAGLSRRGISDLERRPRRSPHLPARPRLADTLNLDGAQRAALIASAQGTAATPLATSPAADRGPDPQAHRNLPVQLTSFIGRDRELGELRKLLVEERMVTLTGPGGVG